MSSASPAEIAAPLKVFVPLEAFTILRDLQRRGAEPVVRIDQAKRLMIFGKR